MPGSGLETIERAGQVCVNDVSPFVQGHFSNGSVPTDPGVIDQAIDPTPFPHHVFHQIVCLLRIGYVRLKEIGLASHALQFRQDRFSVCAPGAVIDRNNVACAAKSKGEGAPYAARRARDENNPTTH